MDLGTGDGRFVVRTAEGDVDQLWIGIDPVAAAMAAASNQCRKRENAMFALGSIEALPAELEGCVGHVTVNLPWGSLLRAVALPEPTALAALARILRPGGTLQVTYSASPRDAGELARLGIDEPDAMARSGELCDAYADAGLDVLSVCTQESADLRELGTTWAKKLWRDPERRAWRIMAHGC